MPSAWASDSSLPLGVCVLPAFVLVGVVPVVVALLSSTVAGPGERPQPGRAGPVGGAIAPGWSTTEKRPTP